MTFAPDSPAGKPWPRIGTTRAVFFWLCMILLAVVLWKIYSAPQPKGRELSYSDFQSQVEKQNVRDVTFYLRANTARLEGTLRSSGERFRTVVPKETIPDLTSQLRKQGVNIQVREGNSGGDWTAMLLNLLPLVLLVLFWIFMMRRWSRRQGPQ
jgi:cell division protease FtsH